MTVTTTNSKTIALGNGVDVEFDFDFVGVSANYIRVLLTDSAGTQVVLDATDYDIVLNDPVPGAIWGIGGTVTYPLSGSPVPAGDTLTIYRELPLTQGIVLQNQASYSQFGQSAEQADDLQVMQTQQVSEAANRTLQFNIVNENPPSPLPPAAECAGKQLVFSSTGEDLIPGVSLDGATVSSAMIPVVEAASLPAARTALGLGEFATQDIGSGLLATVNGDVMVNLPIYQDAANQSVDATFNLTKRAATGALVYTLDRASTLWNGYGVAILALTADVTVVPDAADNFYGQASGEAITIPEGYWGFITCDGETSGLWLVGYEQNVPVSPAPVKALSAMPQGRLTLTQNTPVLGADVVAATTVYYTAFNGNLVPVWNGLNFELLSFAADLSLTLTAAATANSIVDVFAFADVNGALQLGFGPVWTSSTPGACSRGTGAGTTELQRVGGIWANKVQISLRNGATVTAVDAGEATYLGSLFTDSAAGQVTCHVSFGQSRKWGVWNYYNRVPILLQIGDGTSSWNYNTNTVRASNGSSANGGSVFSGMAEELAKASFTQTMFHINAGSGATPMKNGIGLNSTTAFSGQNGQLDSYNVSSSDIRVQANGVARYNLQPALGLNVLTCLEQGGGSGTATFSGGNANMLMLIEWRG